MQNMQYKTCSWYGLNLDDCKNKILQLDCKADGILSYFELKINRNNAHACVLRHFSYS